MDDIKPNGQSVSVDQTVKKDPAAEQGEDVGVLLDAMAKELDRVTSDRDNYRDGLLKAKAKAKSDGTDLDMDEVVSIKVSEARLNDKISELKKSQEETIKRLARENSEAKLALKNRIAAGAASGAGSSQAEEVVQKDYFSPAQLEELKKKYPKMDLERLKKNMQKVASQRTV